MKKVAQILFVFFVSSTCVQAKNARVYVDVSKVVEQSRFGAKLTELNKDLSGKLQKTAQELQASLLEQEKNFAKNPADPAASFRLEAARRKANMTIEEQKAESQLLLSQATQECESKVRQVIKETAGASGWTEVLSFSEALHIDPTLNMTDKIVTACNTLEAKERAGAALLDIEGASKHSVPTVQA